MPLRPAEQTIRARRRPTLRVAGQGLPRMDPKLFRQPLYADLCPCCGRAYERRSDAQVRFRVVAGANAAARVVSPELTRVAEAQAAAARLAQAEPALGELRIERGEPVAAPVFDALAIRPGSRGGWSAQRWTTLRRLDARELAAMSAGPAFPVQARDQRTTASALPADSGDDPDAGVSARTIAYRPNRWGIVGSLVMLVIAYFVFLTFQTI